MSQCNKVIDKHLELCQAVEQVRRKFRTRGATRNLLRPDATSLPDCGEIGVDFV